MKSKVTLIKNLLLPVAATLFVFTFLLASAGAQELRGKIVGRVVDPNGAAVPGASVKVIDVSRNNTTSLTTNDDGLFTAPYLLPGTYQVLVEIAGFKKSIQDKVVVAINETRDVEIKLDLGTPQETVTVTSDPAQLNVSDPNLGLTIDRKRVDELPSVHGDPYHLINLTPGVAYTGSTRLDRPFEPTHIANFAMSGARGIRSDLLIDGAPSTATANANEVIASYVPTTDATQEFKVKPRPMMRSSATPKAVSPASLPRAVRMAITALAITGSSRRYGSQRLFRKREQDKVGQPLIQTVPDSLSADQLVSPRSTMERTRPSSFSRLTNRRLAAAL